MTDLTLVSLFDGVGGFPLAFSRAGVRTVATVEIDKGAADLTAIHFPRVAQFDDVTKVSGDELRAVGFVPERGIVTAGWPCQDNSVAGRRAGLDGARSGLWWHVVRLLDETRPRWFVGENVPGLLSVNDGRDFGAVLGSLAELGYGFAYRVLDAKYFGVPQQRRRVFIVGHLGAPWGASAQVLLEPESGGGDSPQSGKAWPDIAGTLTAGTNSTGGTRPPGTQVDTANTLVVAPALTARYAKGTDSDATDALLVAALTANGVGTCGADDNQAQARHLIATVAGQHTHALTAEGADASEDGTGRGTPIIAYTPDHAATLTSGRSATKGVNAPGRRQEDDTNLVALDLRNAARDLGETQGLGVRPGGPSYTLSAATQRATPGVHVETIVRRLTPMECERLQGYPDRWTDGQSDAQRYREMGNSLAVPVVEWIAHRLVCVDASLGGEMTAPSSEVPTPVYTFYASFRGKCNGGCGIAADSAPCTACMAHRWTITAGRPIATWTPLGTSRHGLSSVTCSMVGTRIIRVSRRSAASCAGVTLRAGAHRDV